MLRPRALVPSRWFGTRIVVVALSTVDDTQTFDVVGSVRFHRLCRMRSVHRLVSSGNRHHRRGGGHRRARPGSSCGPVATGCVMSKAMRDLVEVHPFMTSMNEESIELVSGCARNAVFAPGSLLCAEGGDADTFYLLRRGQVSISVHIPVVGPSLSRPWVPVTSSGGAGWYLPTVGPSTRGPWTTSGASPSTAPACASRP